MKKFLTILAVSLSLSVLLVIQRSYSETAEDYYYQANLSLTSGRINEAVSYYKQAANKRADFFEAYLGLSIAYRELKEYDQAHEAITKVLEIKPDYYQVYYNLGLILEKQGRNAEAVQAYERFLASVPGAARFTDVKQRIQNLKK
ncbi:MAG: hypothetical protein A2Y25_03820 [Candidatus Melainabacteria bacterium GWF2_37_15]|nr:MAG: hypothetical protein A2Y25_03820 [Candidatus Melainabacteria bacterium GWF2_37_15]